MKKLILLELALLFLATTFVSHNPPGWYQQTLPVNDNINDIFFLDSLNGWAVTQGGSSDTSFFLNTINGGTNWNIQQGEIYNPYGLQLIDKMIGYSIGTSGGHSKIYKTTNGGTNWLLQNVLSQVGIFNDLAFVNQDTGWICSIDPFDGGLFKTTNGGVTWQRQLDESYKPNKIFFLNKDTGWFVNSNNKLFNTINSGFNWNLQYSFQPTVRDLFFVGIDTGWIIKTGTNGILKTTNGGFNWINQIDPDPTGSGLAEIYMVSPKIGYIATAFSKIIKTTDGENWGKQNTPDGLFSTIFFTDSITGWSGGGWKGNSVFIHTNDGGGPILSISNSNSELLKHFILYQNNPNPFNPSTYIRYELFENRFVTLRIYDILGNEVKEIINKKQFAGEYKVVFDGSGLPSGVYFYNIKIFNEKSNQVHSETKKMILIR